MKNLHILHGVKFVEPTIELFEKHFPKENIYVLDAPGYESIPNKQLAVEFMPGLLTSKTMQDILIQKISVAEIDNVLFHCLNKRKSSLAYKIKNQSNATLYWVFFGFEVYDFLYQSGRYELFDLKPNKWKKKAGYWFNNFTSFVRFGESRDRAIIRGFESVDYFCCWNEFDYELVKKNFEVTCVFKNFYYYSLYGSVSAPSIGLTACRKVMVNHSGSSDGNHLTILEKLEKYDINKDIEVILPLSYGSRATIIEASAFCLEYFKGRNRLITDFLPRDEYFELLKAYPVAIFGHRRQEAAGNIFRLLANGVKVFLRENNNMLKWLRNHDFIVYSFERDLTGLSALEPLSHDQMLSNNKNYNAIFSEEAEARNMAELFNDAR